MNLVHVVVVRSINAAVFRNLVNKSVLVVLPFTYTLGFLWEILIVLGKTNSFPNSFRGINVPELIGLTRVGTFPS